MSKRITKAVRAVFDEQIATMKRNEEAAGLWCICGHSSPTHDNGFTCQSVACDCLSFRPSNADTRTAEPPAPRAGERDTQSQLFPRYSFAIITGRYKILDNRAESKFPQIATADGEDEARTIVHALNAAEQHATLVAQRERLLDVMRALRLRHREYARKVNCNDCGCDDCIFIQPVLSAIEQSMKTATTIEQEGEAT